MNQRQRDFVRQRAGGRCEYCKIPQFAAIAVQFHCEHIRAQQHHGSHEASNICFCCRNCNLFKGPNQSAYDPESDELVILFNPRAVKWEEHFRLEDGLIIGITPKGRATVELLQMNMIQNVQIREFAGTIESPPDV